MPAELEPKKIPTRRQKLFATAVVVLTVICVWKFIDYRMQPPPPPPAAGNVIGDK